MDIDQAKLDEQLSDLFDPGSIMATYDQMKCRLLLAMVSDAKFSPIT